nr:MAG TPA: CRISPR-associated protein [Caudoviricetes sp.]
MTRQCALTTFDNPFDPFEQFDSWFLFDTEKGYNSCAYLGRIAKTSDQMSDEENDREVERAIDEIVKYDFMNIYKKVFKKKDLTA